MCPYVWQRSDACMKVNEDLKGKEVERIKIVDEERTNSGMYDKNESLKTWANISKILTNEKMEKLERVEQGMVVNTII